MKTTTATLSILTLACAPMLIACSGESTSSTDTHADHAHDHDHSHDGHSHDGHAHNDHDHDHDETPLGSVQLGDITAEAAQGHGNIEPGKELHLVVKLPYTDNGSSIVRAWLGTDDRFASTVAKADYAPSHDDYDLHAIAPDPLPENTMWWIEVTKPDGTKHLGSIAPK